MPGQAFFFLGLLLEITTNPRIANIIILSVPFDSLPVHGRHQNIRTTSNLTTTDTYVSFVLLVIIDVIFTFIFLKCKR